MNNNFKRGLSFVLAASMVTSLGTVGMASASGETLPGTLNTFDGIQIGMGEFRNAGKSENDNDFLFTTAIYIDKDGYQDDKSNTSLYGWTEATETASAGSMNEAENTITGLTITDNESGHNGVIINGAEWTIDKANIVMETSADGSDTCDFTGKGSAIMVTSMTSDETVGSGMNAYRPVVDKAGKVTITNSRIETTGVATMPVFVDAGATATIINSTLISHGGTAYDNYKNSPDQTTMIAPPWILGLMGTARCTNLEGHNSTMNVIDSETFADNWAVLSTDAGSNMALNIYNTTLTLTNEDEASKSFGGAVKQQDDPYTTNFGSGYGTYTIGDAVEVFAGATLNVGTYATIFTGGTCTFTSLEKGETYELMAGGGKDVSYLYEYLGTEDNAEDDIKETVINSDTFGIMAHQGENELIMEKGTVMNSGYASFLVKTGCSLDALISDTEINTGNGVLIQLMDNDDSTTGMISMAEGFNTTHTEYTFEETGFPTEEDISENAYNGSNAANFVFIDEELEGNIYNATGYNVNEVCDQSGMGGGTNAPKATMLNLALAGDTTLKGAVASTSAIHVTYDGSQVVKENGGVAFEDAEAGLAFAKEYQNTSFTISEYYDIGHVANYICDTGANQNLVAMGGNSEWTVTSTSVIAELVFFEYPDEDGETVENNAKVIVPEGVTLTIDGVDYTNCVITEDEIVYTLDEGVTREGDLFISEVTYNTEATHVIRVTGFEVNSGNPYEDVYPTVNGQKVSVVVPDDMVATLALEVPTESSEPEVFVEVGIEVGDYWDACIAGAYRVYGINSGNSRVDYAWRPALTITNEGVMNEYSALVTDDVNLLGGTITKDAADGIISVSCSDSFTGLMVIGADVDYVTVPDFNAGGNEGGPGGGMPPMMPQAADDTTVYYTLKNSTILMFSESDGTDVSDFSGYGAAVMATGDANLIIENTEIYTDGVAKVAVVADNGADVLINDSTITAAGGTIYDDYANTADTTVMVCPPWVLGIRGSARVTNMLGTDTTTTVLDSEITAGGWGVLSTDGCSGVTLTVINSTLTLDKDFHDPDYNPDGEYASGYGTYTIGGTTREYFYGTTFNVGTYAVIMTGGYAEFNTAKAGAVYNITSLNGDKAFAGLKSSVGYDNETVINSDNFGVMFHANGTDPNEIVVNEGTVFNTGDAIFLLKKCANTITVDGAYLYSDSGVIMQMIDNDDTAVGVASFGAAGPNFNDTFYEESGWSSTWSYNDQAENKNATTNDWVGTINMTNGDYFGDLYNGTGYRNGTGASPMVVNLGEGANLTGAVSATEIMHFYKGVQQTSFSMDTEAYKLGRVINQPYFNGYNTVQVTLTDDATWFVTEDGIITSLTVEDDATVIVPAGVTLTVGDEKFTNCTIKNYGYTFVDDNGAGHWAWASDYIYAAHEMGIVKGYPDGTFLPAESVSRIEFVVMLYRAFGEPDYFDHLVGDGSTTLVELVENPFTDATASWYQSALKWAIGTGIVTGRDATTFDPDADISRQEMATILWRALEKPAVKLNVIKGFSDVNEVAAYAQDALNWAVDEGIINGMSSTELAPNGTANRAQAATVLVRCSGLLV